MTNFEGMPSPDAYITKEVAVEAARIFREGGGLVDPELDQIVETALANGLELPEDDLAGLIYLVGQSFGLPLQHGLSMAAMLYKLGYRRNYSLAQLDPKAGA